MGEPNSHQAGKKIGIIGLGSIGLRHLEALQSLGVNDFFHYKTGNGSKVIPESVQSQLSVVSDIAGLEVVDAIIIANPTALHGKAINDIVHLGKPLFIEKPLTDSIEDDVQLQQLLRNYPQRVQIGFCLRFHPVILKVKEILEQGTIGEIYFSRLDVGQYLPSWHPYADYSKEYFSLKSLGGGAIRTLSHEIDLALFFFGQPVSVNGLVLQLSDLKIEVDDYSSIFLKYPASVVNLNIDFLSRRTIRRGVIMGTKADLHYDIIENKLDIVGNDGKQLSFDIPKADIYVEQMRDFMDKKSVNYANMEDSNILINIVEKVEQNSKITQWNSL